MRFGIVDVPESAGRCIRRTVPSSMQDRKLGAGYFVRHNGDAPKTDAELWEVACRQTLKGAAANNTIQTKDAPRGAD